MTASPLLDAYLDTLPGRCPKCRWHIVKQGHSPECGDLHKTEGFSRLDVNDQTNESERLRREILAIGRTKLEFTADDLPLAVRESTNPNRRGRVFAALVESHHLRVVGETKSRNPRAHGKTVKVYRLMRT
jgi:hypothetical protein